jgi:hypothetical protein|tara:strand:+ start:320 stop:529 length:210 start_codon:yes stop_codon:yes gene_type:complete
MGSISDHTDVTHDVESTLESTAPKELELNGDEIKFLLAKIAQLDFKGVEIEFAYNMIIKLQELYKQKVQ